MSTALEKTDVHHAHYDVLVIGSGEAGKYLAWTLSKESHRTAVVERAMVGGSCPNVACLPSKNIIHSARVASLAARGATFGIRGNAIAVDMAAVQHRKRAMVDDLINVHLSGYEGSGVELIMGEARFVAPKKNGRIRYVGMTELASGSARLARRARANRPPATRQHRAALARLSARSDRSFLRRRAASPGTAPRPKTPQRRSRRPRARAVCRAWPARARLPMRRLRAPCGCRPRACASPLRRAPFRTRPRRRGASRSDDASVSAEPMIVTDRFVPGRSPRR